MKVILVNGSPHEKGATYNALREMEAIFEQEGLETEIFWIGNQPIGGCVACGGCRKTGRCAFGQWKVNEFVEKARQADGFVFGSPVHYAAISGSLSGLLDRAFFSGGDAFVRKPAASVVIARRGGCTAAFEQLNKYATINQMPLVSSCYWNQVHAGAPEEVHQDAEGMQTMRVLARNMAWLLRCIQAGKDAGVPLPHQEKRVYTNFIR